MSTEIVMPLATLATSINEHHHAAETAIRSGLEHALEAGRLLIEAKGQCQHGAWGGWLKKHFDGSERTAQAYVRVANRWPEIQAKAQSTADLSIDGALKMLAAAPQGSQKPRQKPPDDHPYFKAPKAHRKIMEARSGDRLGVYGEFLTECEAADVAPTATRLREKIGDGGYVDQRKHKPRENRPALELVDTIKKDIDRLAKLVKNADMGAGFQRERGGKNLWLAKKYVTEAGKFFRPK